MEDKELQKQIESIVGVRINKADKTDKETVEEILNINLGDEE